MNKLINKNPSAHLLSIDPEERSARVSIEQFSFEFFIRFVNYYKFFMNKNIQTLSSKFAIECGASGAKSEITKFFCTLMH